MKNRFHLSSVSLMLSIAVLSTINFTKTDFSLQNIQAATSTLTSYKRVWVYVAPNKKLFQIVVGQDKRYYFRKSDGTFSRNNVVGFATKAELIKYLVQKNPKPRAVITPSNSKTTTATTPKVSTTTSAS